MSDEEKPRRTIAVRKHHSPEVWAQVKRDYTGGATASACSAHYGVSVDALRKRASKEGWCKAHHALTQKPPPPILPFPDAEQAVKTGDSLFVSRWAEIAHAAQIGVAIVRALALRLLADLKQCVVHLVREAH